jgi:hypothetical protein
MTKKSSPGAALAASVAGSFQLEHHERVILAQACEVLDLVTSLQEVVAREGPLVTTAAGDVRVHPAAVELRLERLVLARLLAALRVPDEAGKRPQERPPRGPYRLKVAE